MKMFFQQSFKWMIAFTAVAIMLTACEKEGGDKEQSHGNPRPVSIVPDEGSGNTLVTVSGSDLGEVRTIKFENGEVPATFNPVFNTADNIIFRVPDTANGGLQNIIFTNVDGTSFTMPFTVIALPTVNKIFPLDFEAGSEIEVTGNNLESVSEVQLDGFPETATVLYKEKRKMIIQMPSTTAETCKLKITNSSGSMVTTQVLTNLDRALPIYKDALAPGWDNWSWSLNITNSPDFKITGTGSMKAEYTGAWGGMQLHAGTAINLTPYRYISFWIKGADVSKNMKFNLNWTNDQTLNIPENVWTYYKIDLDIFKNAGVTNFDTFVMQLHDDPKTIYFDNIVLIK